ncbi:purine-nucleoside phosphorylase [Agrilactobacillus fermenti]|uniref:purine-nucleoside phosphorylase n=1 Tax=Agrilactobacillus fermenti TaxID=2586909 RepID=UPI003A5C6393
MSTHIAAKKGEIADRVLLPGDPLRAKFIAENFLMDAKRYNDIRNMYGYTGKYQGVPVSVQATGMGIPSIGIYVHELLAEYQVKKLIRVGTAGGLAPQLKLRDIVLAQAASTDSSVIHNIFGPSISFAPTADFDLLRQAYQAAQNIEHAAYVGNVIGQDRFYDAQINFKQLAAYGVLAAEMETPILYLLAAQYQAQALGIFTISNHIFNGGETTAQERQETFGEMITVALETIIK